MQNTVPQPVILIFLVALLAWALWNAIVSVFYLQAVSRMFALLRNRYPEKWRSLGSPTIFFANFWVAFFKTRKWHWYIIFSDEIPALGDKELTALQNRVKFFWRCMHPLPWWWAIILILLLLMMNRYLK